MRIDIDQEECMSYGKCVADQPDAFAFDDDELAVWLPGSEGLSSEAKRSVARNCPGQAILLFDSDGKRVEP